LLPEGGRGGQRSSPVFAYLRFTNAADSLKLWRDLANGNVTAETLRERGIHIPEDYRKYIALGRFRNALVVDEAARRPRDGIRGFIDAYGLKARTH